mmetsp:Transcript_17090/g.43618  ORF Transcript_17090/g.43618 Transcript_17090/m.43618 type:complete len:326 (-) Transcript_17090:105-1082(-)|eukprot:CAMPEP_0174235138 /NCGR_PEP_ID=MMETSP0417-20130205/4682_1 /TAXON_ID=242541 /ORGANISM="Mayorella sp, Strain BSH-02190019" /LENGTH=325 /DNA_ID=CAMNT_0015313601 /DNA_START=91 /DNA_END=1068 /DNA_ORIENTATION=+
MNKPEKERTTAQIAGVVTFYMVTSLSLVFLNKIMMSGAFPFPIFLTWVQLIVAVGLLVIISALSQSGLVSCMPLIRLEFKTEVARKVLPLTLVFVAMIAFNNLCLNYVEVSFYQVARSLSIMFSILFTYLLLGASTSMDAIKACVIVAIGFVLGAVGEINFSLIGTVFGVTASIFVALNGIYIKRAMPAVNGDDWLLMLYNNVMAIVLFIPVLVLNGEAAAVLDNLNGFRGYDWVMMVVTGVFGFLINIAIILQVQYTSPLTNSISGTLKATLQTIISILVFRNEISLMNGFGIFLVILGSGYYSRVRYMERMERERAAATLPKA